MASPRAADRERHERARNARLADWLAREKRAYLAATARRAGAASGQVEDVVQTGLASFISAFPGPDRPAAALAYCAACVASAARKARRRHARKEGRTQPFAELERGDVAATSGQAEPADPEAADPAELAIAHEQAAKRRRILVELPEDQRAVIVLSAAGYGAAEIAALFGLSCRAVRRRIEKANRRLRESD